MHLEGSGRSVIEDYIHQIDRLLSTSPAVRRVEVIRCAIRDTDLERVLHYRYRIHLIDGGIIETSERVVEIRGNLEITKYRHHWQNADSRLVKRWDNAPHHPEVDTFPHHLHHGTDNQVMSHPQINGLEALRLILEDIG